MAAITAAAAALIGAPRAHAANIAWTNPAGGDFDNAVNWNAGAGPAPGVADLAQFNLASTYTTVFNADASTSGLEVSAGDVTFANRFTPHTYTVTTATLTGGKLTLATVPVSPPLPPPPAAPMTLQVGSALIVNGGATMLVSGGNDVVLPSSGYFLNLGTVNGPMPGLAGAMTIDGAGSTLSVASSTRLGDSSTIGSLSFANNASGSLKGVFTGSSGSRYSGAQLTVASGADLVIGGPSAGNGYVNFATFGGHASQNNSITVTGAGSTLNQDGGFFTVGGGLGPVLFTVSDGGELTTSGGGYRLTISSNATLDFTGGTINPRGQIEVMTNQPATPGMVGGIVKRTDATGTINWADGFKGFSVGTGALVDLAGAMTFAAPSSSFTVPNTVNGANATMRIGALTMADRASISVTNGGRLEAGSLSIAPATDFSAPGVSIDGAGSSLLAGATTVGVATKSAMLTLRNNATGTFTGTLTVAGGSQSGVEIATGADVTAANIVVGPTPNGPALFSVGDAGSTVTQTGASTLTIDHNGFLGIRNGAIFTTGTGGIIVSDNGRIDTSGGVLNANGDITASGVNSIGISGGLLNWVAGRTMTVANVNVSSTGDMLNLAGNTISVTGAQGRFAARDVAFNGQTSATFSGGGRGSFRSFRIGSDGTGGAVIVDGAGSTLSNTSVILTNTIGGSAGGAPATLEIRNGGALSTFDGSTLIVKPTGTLNIDSNAVRVGALTVDGGAVNIDSGRAVSVGGALSTANGGNVTMSEGTKLIVRGGDVGSFDGVAYSSLSGEIARAYHFGAWDGNGVRTSQADAVAGLTTIAIATADETPHAGGTFGGLAVSSGDALMMYTYAGDANLDGIIDGGDYGIIDNFAQVPGAFGYASGDFNYDGIIDGGDYGIIDNNIQAQGAPFPTSAAPSMDAVTAVPEPSGWSLALMLTAGCFARRWRRLPR